MNDDIALFFFIIAGLGFGVCIVMYSMAYTENRRHRKFIERCERHVNKTESNSGKKGFWHKYFYYMLKIFTYRWGDILAESYAQGNCFHLIGAALHLTWKTFFYLFMRLLLVVFFPLSPLLIMYIDKRNQYFNERMEQEADRDL